MDGNGCSIGTHILSYKPELEKAARKMIESSLELADSVEAA